MFALNQNSTMIKFTLLLCMVASSLAEWVDPDWRAMMVQDGRKFPPLPKSVPVFSYRQLVTETPEPSSAPYPSSPMPSSSMPPTTAPSECKAMFGCADCNTAQVCRPSGPGSFVSAFTLRCPATTPYCDYSSGTCTTVPDPKCGSQDNKFVCLDNGYFPDATNCTIYHACNNYQPQMFKCAEGLRYDPEAKECNSAASCSFNVKCDGLSEVKLGMGKTHYYSYCSNGQPIVVSRCPGEYKLNSTSQVCEPLCERDGLMTDNEDCTKFYQCTSFYISPSLSVPIRKNLACPLGEAFESTSYQCVPKTLTQCK